MLKLSLELQFADLLARVVASSGQTIPSCMLQGPRVFPESLAFDLEALCPGARSKVDNLTELSFGLGVPVRHEELTLLDVEVCVQVELICA